MPEATIFRARIGIESLPDAVGREFVFRISCLVVKDQQKILGEHAVEIIKLDLAHFALPFALVTTPFVSTCESTQSLMYCR